jgi:uncharacterized protein YjbJ (UPF0337 family)
LEYKLLIEFGSSVFASKRYSAIEQNQGVEIIMSIPNKDEAEGKWEQVKGTVKEKVGEMTGDRELEAEGDVQNAEGETQETWGKFKRGVGDAIDAVGDAVSNTGKDIGK